MKINFSSVSIALSVLLCLSSCENTNTPINNGKSSEDDKNTTVDEGNKEEPKLALEYVAEFNVGKTPKSWAEGQKNDQSGFYTWTDAKNACPDGTHLPSQKEWRGIIPDYPAVNLSTEGNQNDVREEIEVHGETASYNADYLNTGENISYALRFKDKSNSMLAAYRYERVGEFDEDVLDSQIKVTARYLGSSFKGDVKTIASEDFWNKDNSKDVTRIFPASGVIAPGGEDVTNMGYSGYFWSSTEFEGVSSMPERAVYFNIGGEGSLNVTDHYDKSSKFSVRPFKD